MGLQSCCGYFRARHIVVTAVKFLTTPLPTNPILSSVSVTCLSSTLGDLKVHFWDLYRVHSIPKKLRLTTLLLRRNSSLNPKP